MRTRLATINSVQLRAGTPWVIFWQDIQKSLRSDGYRGSTLVTYRQVLHNLRAHMEHAGISEPGRVTPEILRSYIYSLSGASGSWLAMNVCILRNCFDRLAGKNLTAGLPIPKRGEHLPVILSREDICRIVQAADHIRDRLIIGLLYGSGVKTGELRHLKWKNIAPDGESIILKDEEDNPRWLPVARELQRVFKIGRAAANDNDYVFKQRSREDAPIAARTVERMLHRVVQKAGIQQNVTPMVLRHSFAVHCLEDGVSIRNLQVILGHELVETTLRYQSCILKDQVLSPIDRLPHPRIPGMVIPETEIIAPFEDPRGPPGLLERIRNRIPSAI